MAQHGKIGSPRGSFPSLSKRYDGNRTFEPQTFDLNHKNRRSNKPYGLAIKPCRHTSIESDMIFSDSLSSSFAVRYATMSMFVVVCRLRTRLMRARVLCTAVCAVALRQLSTSLIMLKWCFCPVVVPLGLVNVDLCSGEFEEFESTALCVSTALP